MTTFKDTNIKWIWKIPEDWTVVPLKHYFSFEKWKDAQIFTGEYCSKNQWIYPVYSGQTKDNWIMAKIDSYIYESKDRLFVTTVWAKAMTISIISWKYSLSQNCALIKETNNHTNVKFYSYLLKILFSYEKGLLADLMQPSLRFEDLVEYKIILPPLSTQTTIANFLDNKTDKISTFIKNKKETIKLLQEQKQAIIHKAVTTGLEEWVKMKDTWNKWIWTIPKQWKVIKLKYLINTLTDFTSNGSFASLAKNVKYFETWYSRLIRLTDIRVDFKNLWVYVTEKAHKFLKNSELFWGEILIANVWAYTWFVCIMPKVDFISTLWPNMLLLRFNNNVVLDKYIYYFLLSDLWSKQLILESESSAQPKLNKHDLKNITVFLPKLNEQKWIVEYIEKETNLIDTAISKIESEIQLIEEYKNSLIYNAVTGKINI